MNPPRDADADGSPSNCCAFFISVVHDLSLHQILTASSTPSHNRNSFLLLSSPPVQLSLASSPVLPPCHGFLLLPLYFYFVSASLCSRSHHPPPNLFPWLVLSLVQMCPWSAVAWLGDNRSDFETGGMAALLSLTQSYSDEPSTAKGRQRKEK